jgi:membrane glycosyltransferase
MVVAVNRISAPLPRLRRWLFVGLVSGTTLVGVDLMLDIVGANGFVGLEIIIFALFALTFGWISISFWNAVIGFVLTALRRDPLSLRHAPVAPADIGQVASRTALVMPVYNEDPVRVTRSLAAMLRSLERAGISDAFDAFLLSDTNNPAIAQAEEAAFEDLRQQLDRPGAVRYRRRTANIGRKAGNIEDFCQRWGSGYDFMVVLDADSIMTGSTLGQLVRAMEATPDAGLMQTVPTPVDRTTLFGRLLQFAACLYSPMLAAGQSFWQTDAANYWGHNAIIRVRAFAEHCRLPVLPGRPPLGGAILSHDFVEAALLRRAGWGVYMLADTGGSYEDVPDNIVDYAIRDRRWCQGSLQHLRLLSGRGLRWMSRLHFVLGAMGYVSSFLWFLMLLASTAYIVLPSVGLGRLTWVGSMLLEQVSVDQPSTTMNGERIIPLLGVTIVLLFLPKLLALALALARERQSFGGRARLLLSAVLEMLFAVIVAPLMMMYHARFVLSVLGGHSIEWETQAREGRTVGWSEAWRRTAGVVAVGATWAGLTLYYSPTFFLWLTPIFAGLLSAGPLVRLTSSRSLGQLARRWGLFLVPAETVPPPELQESQWPVSDALVLGSTPFAALAADREKVEA